jgi:hypothetical protein
MADIEAVRHTLRMRGRLSDIAISFVVITIPMLLFAILLLGLVFFYRVTHNSPPYMQLQLQETTEEPGVYYVKLNSAFLVFIASWSSSLAPILTGFVLTLAAYPICKQYLGQARANLRHELLTPYQLALTLQFMNGGGFGAMWGWLKYHVKWKHVQYSRGSVLSRTVLVGVIASMLGYVIVIKLRRRIY